MQLLIPLHAEVGIGPGYKISAIILAICIRGDGNVTYECVWWDGENRKTEWLHSSEIKFSDRPEMQVGFLSKE